MKANFITALRKNHALEHATIAVLIGKVRAGTRLFGRAAGDGFYIYGDVSNETVSQAADEGLARLKRGEHTLAVSPLCGTNLVVTALLAGLASRAAMRDRKKTVPFSNVFLATLAAVTLAQPLGRLAQKHFTTSSDIADVEVTDVSSRGTGARTRHKIRTLQS